MKLRNFTNYLLVIGVFAVFSLTVLGQTGSIPQETPNNPQAGQKDGRQNLLMQLGLSRDQIRELRQLNQARRPIMEAAQLRVREATRSLDDAIYNDQLIESELDDKVKELQLAQAEITKLRAANEIAVRKLLTPEQLVRFRDLRDRFEEIKKNIDTRRKNRVKDNIQSPVEKVPVAQPGRQFVNRRQKP